LREVFFTQQAAVLFAAGIENLRGLQESDDAVGDVALVPEVDGRLDGPLPAALLFAEFDIHNVLQGGGPVGVAEYLADGRHMVIGQVDGGRRRPLLAEAAG